MLYADSTKGQGTMMNSGRKGKHNTSNAKQHMPPLLKGRKSNPGRNIVMCPPPQILGALFTK
jgi:hypothetical protein